MALTLEQQIAKKEKDLALLKEKVRKAENGQKIIIGGMMLSLARKDPETAESLLALIDKNINRKTDETRLEGVIEELNEIVSKHTEQQSMTQSYDNQY